MAVKVTVGDKELHLNATQYSVDEDSTPVNPADETGGTAQINYTLPAYPGWKTERHKNVEVRDDTQGRAQGSIKTMAEQNGVVQFTADSRILNMSAKRTAQPFAGNLRDAILYYLSLVDITENIVIEDGFELIQVNFPGWIDDVYQTVARKLCPAWSMEMSLVGKNIVFRSFRTRKAILRRLQSLSENIDDGSRAQKTLTTWYDTEYVTNSLVYPPGGWTPDVETFDVNASEVKVWEDVQIETSLFSINQPVCTSNIGPAYSDSSVYTVSGADGLPISPQMWKDYGGYLTVEINEDRQSLKITVKGMDFNDYAPYTIGIASGPSNYYSTLRLVGEGIALNKTDMEHASALTADEAPTEFADAVDNIFIISKQQAFEVSAWQLAEARGPAHKINFQAGGINRNTDSGSYNYATFADFDEHFAGKTFAQADAEWAGKTTDDWDEFWEEEVSSDFKNQAFGNIAGARIYVKDSIFRIRTASNAGGVISGSAEADNTVGDFDAYYDGMTFADFDAMWAGKTFDDFDTSPFPGIR